MDFLRVWVIPPLIGAVIGYFTNWLAIKMLFRPFQELRFLSLRVPFTPGLLPRERERIASSIGRTVSAELLTESAVKKRLAEPDIRAALMKAVVEGLDSLLAMRAAAALPTRGSLSGPLGRLVASSWETVVASDAFKAALEAAVRRALVEAESLPLSRFVSPGKAEELAALVLAPPNVASLRSRAGAWIESIYEAGGALGREAAPPLVPPEALEPVLAALVEGLYRAALPAVESFLAEPGVKSILGRYANEIVGRAIGRLNLFQRLIVGAAQYERRIAEGMPETVADMTAAAMAFLRGPDMPARASAAAAAALRKAAAEPLRSSIARLLSREAARSALDAAIDALAESGPSIAARAAAIAAARSDASLASLVKAAGLPSEEIASRAADAASRALAGSGEGAEAGRILASILGAFAGGLEASLGERSLAQAIGIGNQSRDELAAYLADEALALVSREAGRIVAGLDVGRIVADRINELDLAEVERIVVDVAGRELYWITVLGGVLGGAIGILQSLVTFLWG